VDTSGLILIGMFDSPFVRRVAVSLQLLGLPFEHRNWSVGKDFELIRQFNPLGRVPALVRSDGEVLIDSAAILEFIDEAVGPERALLPPSGDARRRALHIVSLALGAADKGVLLLHETIFRPKDKHYFPWIERCRTQMHGALAEIDRLAHGREWMIGGRMTQADITAACVFSFLSDALNLSQSRVAYPGLSAISARCESLPAFVRLQAKFIPPAPPGVYRYDSDGASA
jgi:glutathione S-transferase